MGVSYRCSTPYLSPSLPTTTRSSSSLPISLIITSHHSLSLLTTFHSFPITPTLSVPLYIMDTPTHFHSHSSTLQPKYIGHTTSTRQVWRPHGGMKDQPVSNDDSSHLINTEFLVAEYISNYIHSNLILWNNCKIYQLAISGMYTKTATLPH